MINKRGQFYLIAALIIIVILGSFATLFFNNQKDSQSKIYDIREELNIESENVLDYGTYNSYSSDETTDLIENFSSSYADYKGQDKSIVFIYGNDEEIYQLTYDKATRGEIGLGGDSNLEIPGLEKNKKILDVLGGRDKKSVKVTFSENLTREVGISQGENFYFIISEETEGETYIVESEDSDDSQNEED